MLPKPQSVLVLATLSMLLLAPLASAESLMEQFITQRFAKADSNNDQRLTRVEAEANMPKVAKHYDKIDLEQKGYVTLEQILNAVKLLKNQ